MKNNQKPQGKRVQSKPICKACGACACKECWKKDKCRHCGHKTKE